MIKRMFISLIVVLNILVIPVYGINIVTDVSKQSVELGEQITYIIKFDENILTTDFKLKYDSSKLEYIGTNTDNIETEYFEEENCLKVIYIDENGIGTNQIELNFKTKELVNDTSIKIQEINLHTIEKQESFNISDESKLEKIENKKISIIKKVENNTGTDKSNDKKNEIDENSKTDQTVTKEEKYDDIYPGVIPKAGANVINNILVVLSIIFIIIMIVSRQKLRKVLPLIIIVFISGQAIKAYATNSILIKEYNKINGYEKIVAIVPDLINENITSSDFFYLAELSSKILKIEDKNGSEINEKQNIGTGAVITLKNGEKYNAIVYGDVNGDGLINSNDIACIIENRLKKIELAGINKKAANLVNSGDEEDKEINSRDIQRIKDFILKRLKNSFIDVLPEEIKDNPVDDDNKDEKIITKIEVKELPIKTTYVKGEDINLEGGVITILYNDGTTENVLMSSNEVKAEYDLNSPGEKTIKITYQEKSVTFIVTVRYEEVIFNDKNMYNAVIEQLGENAFAEKDDEKYTIKFGWKQLDSVTKLELNNNNITNIKGIEKFSQLTELNISNNNITDISGISKLGNLSILEVYGNTIADITPISKLINLRVLNLAKNKLEDNIDDSENIVTQKVRGLTNLVELDMSHNYLRYTEGLDKLTNLTTLNLYDNAIQDLSGLNNLVNLVTLKLGENNEQGARKIDNIDILNSLVNLKYLDFSENNVQEIIENITNLKNLEVLNLEKNQLTDISKLGKLTNLKDVNLYNNKITEISQLAQLQYIEKLILNKNGISSLKGIANNNKLVWNNIKELDIAENNIDVNVNSNILKILSDMSNKKLIELDYENITDVTNLPHYDENRVAYVTYDDFGARCDGKYDDFIAIRNAHTFANSNNCEVRGTTGKTYHIFKFYDDVANINTNVDWNDSTFIIHDEEIEEVSGRFSNLFKVNNITETITINHPSWTIGTETKQIAGLSEKLKTLNSKGYTKYLCIARNSTKKQYIRYGIDSSGYNQQDYFLIDSECNVLNDIQWDFEKLTSITVEAIPNSKIDIKNGTFISNALNSQSETTYMRWNSGKSVYFSRNIYVYQSANINFSGIKHTLSNDELSGSYRGFLQFGICANVNISDSELYTRKYSMDGRSTYDLYIMAGVNVTCKNITSNSITDDDRWGITATSFSKDVLFENCSLNRIDAHEGIYNLTVRDCNIGAKGLTMTGQGKLDVINTTITAETFIRLRGDYGSTWNGNVNIIDSTFIYKGVNEPKLVMFTLYLDKNGKIHDFGYDCKYPNINVENLTVDNRYNTKYNYVVIIPNSEKAGTKYAPDSYWPDKINVNGYNFINNTLSNPYIKLKSNNLGNMKGDYVITNNSLKTLQFQRIYDKIFSYNRKG